MYELVGYSYVATPDEYGTNNGSAFIDETEEVVATFDNKKDAENYIKKSKLKQRVHNSWGSDKVFRSNSLLKYYESAWVQEKEEPDIVPHNPTI